MLDKLKFKLRQQIIQFLRIDERINLLQAQIDSTAPNLLIDKAARFAACEMVEGDYLEFGVFRGDSLVAAYRAFEKQFESRIRQDVGGAKAHDHAERRRSMWNGMRFFGFDSFKGLPPLETSDAGTEDFERGMYANAKDSVSAYLKQNGVPLERVRLVEGYFSETCSPAMREQLGISKASCILIDGDLYSSCRDSLMFIGPLLQEGTIIIFDDWFSYRGSPLRGEQLAFNEWKSTDEVAAAFDFVPYHKESWKRASFVTVSREI
jgi:O-methyltransferase